MLSYLFVYGILRNGRIIKEINPKNKYIGEANTKGKLYDLGIFPAAFFYEEGNIKGEIFEVCDKTLIILDKLEGVDTNFYKRIEIEAIANKKMTCFAYEFVDYRIIEKATFVQSGDFYAR